MSIKSSDLTITLDHFRQWPQAAAALMLVPLVLLSALASLVEAPPPAPAHLRFSSAYAWNASSLSSSAFNLAQAKSVNSATALALRGLPSALAAFQGPVFVRTTGSRRLAPDWEAQLDKVASEMRPHVRAGAIEAVFLGDEICCHVPACLNGTLAPVAQRLRSHFPNRTALPIWTNECSTTITGSRGSRPLPLVPGAIPGDIDILCVSNQQQHRWSDRQTSHCMLYDCRTAIVAVVG